METNKIVWTWRYSCFMATFKNSIMHPEIYFTLVFSFIIPTIQHNAKLISIELTVFFPTCDVCRVSIYSIQTCICSVERQNTSHTAVFCLSLQTHFCSKLLHQSLRKDSLSATAQEAPCGCKKKNHRLWFCKTSWIGVKIATCGVKKCHPGVNKRFKMESRSMQAPCLSFA